MSEIFFPAIILGVVFSIHEVQSKKLSVVEVVGSLSR